MAYTIPFYGDTTGRFGDFESWRDNPHRGHDVAPGRGVTFPSWVNGVVVTAEKQSCLGWTVVVQNRDDGYYIGVAHLDSVWVRVGQTVEVGTALGQVGNTGTCTTGSHAHITVSPSSRFPWSGAVVDPVAYARSGPSGGGGGGVTNYAFGLNSEAQGKSQAALTKLGLYSGPIDNVFGSLSVQGMQLFLKNNGYLPADYVVDGEPGPIYGGGLQRLAAAHGYTGPIDNVPGEQTSVGIINWANSVLATTPQPPQQADWAAWQVFLQGYGYTGPVDGVPGENTYKALQQFLAEKFGYTGPIDGDPGENTWAAFQKAVQAGYPGAVTPPPPADDWKAWQAFLRAWGYEGPIDGDPGENTYIALQKFLAAQFAYTGPIDGDPGDFTWAAFERAKAAGYPSKGTTPTPDPEPEKPLPGAFMIDVAKYQLGINYATVKAAGVMAGVVKAAGRNVLPAYVADGYHEHVDGFRTAGMEVGHYYVPGKGATPKEQAKFFYDSLYDFRAGEDILMLDNEVLDENGLLFNDAEVVEFVTELQRLAGIKFESIWVYGGAKDWRGVNAPWAATMALPVQIVWAAYGDYPTGPRPDHVPALNGKISRWDIHQYTSRFRVSGKDVDAMHSPKDVTALFDLGLPDPGPDPDPCELDNALADMQAVIDKYKTP